MTFEFNLSRQERGSPVEDFQKRFSRQTGTVVILCDKSAQRDQGCVYYYQHNITLNSSGVSVTAGG